MKLPRDLSGTSLARKLSQFDYKQTRQTGSHLRRLERLLKALTTLRSHGIRTSAWERSTPP